MTKHLKTLIRDEEGAMAIEYAFLASLIAVVVIVAVTAIGLAVNDLFVRVNANYPQ